MSKFNVIESLSKSGLIGGDFALTKSNGRFKFLIDPKSKEFSVDWNQPQVNHPSGYYLVGFKMNIHGTCSELRTF